MGFNKSEIRDNISNGLKWNVVGQVGRYLLQLFFGLTIARILGPEDYGIVGMVLSITAISSVFIEGGFNSSIIQSKKIDELDLNTIMISNLAIGAFFTVLFFLSSKLISEFYEDTRLNSIVKVLAFVYIIQSVSVSHRAYLARNFSFKKLTLIELSGLVISGTIGLVLATKGYNYWSLVFRTLIAQFIITILLILMSEWKMKIVFSLSVFKKHWKYSSKLLFANLIDQFSRKLDDIIVGKLYSARVLGMFSTSRHYAFLGVNLSSLIIKKTFFPLFSKLQDQEDDFNKLFHRLLEIILFIFLPLFTILIVHSGILIYTVLGEKWTDMSVFFRLFCISGIIYIINQYLSFIINSKGKPKYNLKFQIVGNSIKFILIISLLVFKYLPVLIFIYIYICFLLFGVIYRIKVINKIGLNICIGKFLYSNANTLAVYSSFFLLNLLIDIFLSNLYSKYLFILLSIFYFVFISYLTKNPTLFFLINYIRKRIHNES